MNVTVRNNTIYNSAQNVGVSRDSSGVRVLRNVLVGPRRPTSSASSWRESETRCATTSGRERRPSLPTPVAAAR